MASRLYWRVQDKAWHQTISEDVEVLREALIGLLVPESDKKLLMVIKPSLLFLVKKYIKVQEHYSLKVSFINEDMANLEHLKLIKNPFKS